MSDRDAFDVVVEVTDRDGDRLTLTRSPDRSKALFLTVEDRAATVSVFVDREAAGKLRDELTGWLHDVA